MGSIPMHSRHFSAPEMTTIPVHESASQGVESIPATIRTFIARTFRDGRREGLEPETPLVTSGIVDSAGVLELVTWLEERFGIRVEDVEVTVENFDTLAALAELVRGKTSDG